MSTKYRDVRIVARRDCPWCGGRGERVVTAHADGAQSRESTRTEPCPQCDGAGHTDTDLLLPGEPFFLVRGKDALGPAMVAVYDGLMATVGAAAMTDRMHDDLMRLRERMSLWQMDNPGVVKHAD